MATQNINIPNPKPITIALIQMSMVEDADQNLTKAASFIKEAAVKGAQIVCLPELFRTPYFCTQESPKRDYSEPLDHISEKLSKIAAENKIILVSGSVYEKAQTLGYNTALVFDSSGKELGRYRKIHIPHDPAFYEQHYFTPGDQGYKIFETEVAGEKLKIGVLICYDQWFPEAARTLALKGADIIFYPTAIGTVEGILEKEGSWQDAWTTVQRGHAVANSLVVAGVNRVGTEGKSTFWGGSFVSDAFGKLLCHGGKDEQVLIATIDLSHSKYVKDSWRFFKERRPDTYGKLIEEGSK